MLQSLSQTGFGQRSISPSDEDIGGSTSYRASLRLVNVDENGLLSLSDDTLGELTAADLPKGTDLPPLSGLGAADFNRDGVDDLFVATPANGIIWLGKPATP